MQKAKSAILFCSDSHGVYIPQYWAESVNREMVKYVSAEEYIILESGPEHEWYWETWDSVLSNAETIDGGIFWQDGDLWLIYADHAREVINEHCQNYLEYEESHKDAGNAYAHMPAESWSTTDEMDLAKYIESQAINTHGLDIETLSDIALENFSMFSGHIFGAYDLGQDDLILAAYPVQEVEIDLSGLGLDDITLEFVRESCDAYIKGDLAYMTTNAAWYAGIEKDKFQQAIAEYAESK